MSIVDFIFISELSKALVEYVRLCLDGKLDEVRQHLSQMRTCINWLDPNFKIVLAPKDDDSDSTSDDDSGDEDMEVNNDDDEAPTLIDTNQRNQRNRSQPDEDGWINIPVRRR